ncbi:MAG: DNA recombination/repair protein RecA, partial [Chloroflexi bacterium]|nr:DNA recombination/repair protein RecA [Chloroflexota bacterium]
VKNKVAPPFKQAEFDIMFKVGISKAGDLIDLGVEMGIVRKSGANYSYNETRFGQGRENSKEFLQDHPEILAELEKHIRGQHASTNGHRDAPVPEAVEVEGDPVPASAG